MFGVAHNCSALLVNNRIVRFSKISPIVDPPLGGKMAKSKNDGTSLNTNQHLTLPVPLSIPLSFPVLLRRLPFYVGHQPWTRTGWLNSCPLLGSSKSIQEEPLSYTKSLQRSVFDFRRRPACILLTKSVFRSSRLETVEGFISQIIMKPSLTLHSMYVPFPRDIFLSLPFPVIRSAHPASY